LVAVAVFEADRQSVVDTSTAGCRAVGQAVGRWPVGNQKHTKRARDERMWAVVGYLSARPGDGAFIRQVQDEENKYVTSRGSRKGVKTKGNEGEGALPATDLRSNIPVSIGVRKCDALDSEHEGETNAARLLAKV